MKILTNILIGVLTVTTLIPLVIGITFLFNESGSLEFFGNKIIDAKIVATPLTIGFILLVMTYLANQEYKKIKM